MKALWYKFIDLEFPAKVVVPVLAVALVVVVALTIL